MRPAGLVIAPDHDRPSRSKDALVLVYVAYLMFHQASSTACPVVNKSTFICLRLFILRAVQRREYSVIKKDLLDMLQKGVDVWNAWKIQPERGKIDLSHSDLSRFNLSYVNFEFVNLSGAYLHEAFLKGANLRNADLSHAKLGGACLNRVDLKGVNLREADLSEAYLYGADLREADLSEANLNEAYLHEAKLYQNDFVKLHLTEDQMKGLKLLPNSKESC
jgi:uncharacterized protein YjbI with pentapeptide repeats